MLKLFFDEDVQRIFDHFSSVFNIRILFYSADGAIVKVGLNRPNARYCQLIQQDLYGVESCLYTDAMKREEAARRKEIVCYRCHAGLEEALTPVYSGDHLLGFIGLGQFRSGNEIDPIVARDWGKKHKNDNLRAAFNELPLYRRDKIKDIIGLFTVLVDYIVSRQMITSGGDIILQRAISYIETNIRRPVMIEEVAGHVKKSVSTISHLFRKKLNSSFKQMVISIKLDKADEYFRTIPGIKISDAAEKVGYDDPLYFSRIYKKYRHITPSQYQEGLKSKAL